MCSAKRRAHKITFTHAKYPVLSMPMGRKTLTSRLSHAIRSPGCECGCVLISGLAKCKRKPGKGYRTSVRVERWIRGNKNGCAMGASVEIVVISRKGRLPACRNPTAVAAEHRCKGNLGCFFFGELPAPRGTTGRRGSRSAVVVFHVAGGLFVGGLAPVVPSLRADVLAEVAIHEQRVGVGPPRTPEIHLVYLGSCRKPVWRQL